MKKVYLFLIVICILPLWAELPWQLVRYSALTADEELAVRCQTVPQIESQLYYDSENGTGMSEMNPVTLQPLHLEAFFPPIQDDITYLGFRTVLLDPAPDEAGVIAAPVYYRYGNAPAYQNLSWIMDDEVGDVPQQEDFLDIINTYCTFDDNRLYLAMQNNGGGYPVLENAWGPFYSYMMLITPPDESQIPFGMLYTVEQQPYIQPGLYKMTGTGMEDLQLIGAINITEDEENDLLMLDCLWEDLLADEDFTAWFDEEDPMLTTLVYTNVISLAGGLEDADMCDYCTVYPQETFLLPQPNILPQLSDFEIVEDSLIACTYLDFNANFALTAQAVMPDSSILDLVPQSYDFNQPVIYQSLQSHPALADSSWQWITLRFSDNDVDFAELTVYNEVDAVSDLVPESPVNVSYYPNPFNPELTISFSLIYDSYIDVSIYNAKGQKVRTLAQNTYSGGEHQIMWDGKDYSGKVMGSGAYLFTLRVNGRISYSGKCMLLK